MTHQDPLDERDLELAPAVARQMMASLVDLAAQLRVDGERERQNAHRSGMADPAQSECRGYAKAVMHLQERLDPIVFGAIPEERRLRVRQHVEAEATRRLEEAMRRDQGLG